MRAQLKCNRKWVPLRLGSRKSPDRVRNQGIQGKSRRSNLDHRGIQEKKDCQMRRCESLLRIWRAIQKRN